jgi:hypothetical protein
MAGPNDVVMVLNVHRSNIVLLPILDKASIRECCSMQKIRSTIDLQQTHGDFAVGVSDEQEIYNMDETAVYYDIPPLHLGSEGGSPTTELHQENNSARLTSVMTARADGTNCLDFCQ